MKIVIKVVGKFITHRSLIEGRDDVTKVRLDNGRVIAMDRSSEVVIEINVVVSSSRRLVKI